MHRKIKGPLPSGQASCTVITASHQNWISAGSTLNPRPHEKRADAVEDTQWEKRCRKDTQREGATSLEAVPNNTGSQFREELGAEAVQGQWSEERRFQEHFGEASSFAVH